MSTISVVGITPAFQAGNLGSNPRWYTEVQQTTMTDGAFMAGSEVMQFIRTGDMLQVQPNGVDLTAGDLLKPSAGFIRRDEKAVGKREPYDDKGDHWIVDEPVIVKYGERIKIPEDHIGFVFPRSTLMRNGCELHTAVWDSGYEGMGEGLLVPHTEIIIEQDARIAQMVFASASSEETYDGDYQREGLEDSDA